jgi:hypothetical protein
MRAGALVSDVATSAFGCFGAELALADPGDGAIIELRLPCDDGPH